LICFLLRLFCQAATQARRQVPRSRSSSRRQRRRRSSEARTSSTKTSTSAAASHGPGGILAGRTAVPIVCGLGAVDDDCAIACRPPRRHHQSEPRLQSCQHRLARAHYERTLNGTARSLKLADNRREVAFESLSDRVLLSWGRHYAVIYTVGAVGGAKPGSAAIVVGFSIVR